MVEIVRGDRSRDPREVPSILLFYLHHIQFLYEPIN